MTTRDYLRLLRRRKWLLLLAVVGCVVAALLYNLLGTPVFQGRSALLVRSDEGGRTSILAAAAPVLSLLGEPKSLLGGADLATQVQIINSRPSLEHAYGLIQREAPLLQRVRGNGLSEADLQALVRTLDRLPASPPPSAWDEKYQALLDTLLVSGIEDSQVIELRCESSDRELAADFANALALAYLGSSLADSQAAARRSWQYVQDELVDTEAQLADAEQRLRQFGESTGTVALQAAAEQTMGLLSRLDEQAAAAEAQMRGQAALEQDLLGQLATQDERIVASTIMARNPDITGLQSALATAEAERMSLLAEYTENSPLVRQASAKVEELRRGLAETAEEVLGSRQETINPIAQEIIKQMGVARGEHLAARESLAVIKRAIREVEAQLAQMPAEQLTLLRLQREVQLLEKIYLALKEKEQEYEISEKTMMPASSLVEQSILADKPLRPKRILNLAVAIIAGGLLGLLLVGFAEHFDESFTDPEEVASTLGVPVLAVLGGPEWAGGPGAAPGAGPMREAVEALLSHVRAGVAGEGEGGPAVALLVPVTSDADASALADAMLRAAAQQGSSGLLVAGDGPGLAEVARGGVSVDELAQPMVGQDAVRVLEIGAEPLNVLSAGQIRSALAGAGADLVAVVCPPGSGVSAVRPLLASGWPALLVIAMRGTTCTKAVRLVQLLSELGASPLGAVLTGAPRCEAEYYPAGTTGA